MKKECLFKIGIGLLIVGGVASCSSSSQTKAEETRAVEASNALLLSRHQGYTLKFKTITGATSYVVYDDNDYRDGVTLYPEGADENGYLYYTTEVVGKHNVYVKGYTPNGVVVSNTVAAVENKPVFDYSPFAPVYFYNVNDLTDTSATYTVIKDDGSLLTVSQSEFNANYIYNQNGTIDFTTTTIDKYKISTLLSDLKAKGSNVVNLANRFLDIETGNQWWWGGKFENSVCKRVMDAAWSLGMKCIVSDFAILTNSENDTGPTVAANRIASSEFKKVAQHPAFYGIELNDEPLPITQSEQTHSEIENACLTVQSILNTWHNDSLLKTLPDPFIHTDLASYNDIEDGYFDEGISQYKEYLLNWITGTGLDYLCFDVYTYSTYQYGNRNLIGTSYYDPSKAIYDCINEIKTQYPNLKVHQTLTRSNDKSRNNVTYKDVYGSTFLAISQGNFGYSGFTNTLDNNTRRNACLDKDYLKTDTYTWANDADKQYRNIVGLLDGYTLTSNTITDYSRFGYAGYGDGLRTSTSVFTNSENKTCTFKANYGTVGSNYESITVADGKTYYKFGKDITFAPSTGTGDSIKVNQGEAILVIDDVVSPLSQIAKTVELGYNVIFDNGELCQKLDKFVIKVAVDNNKLKDCLTQFDSYGIYLSTSSKNHYFDKTECSFENNNTSMYVVVNLGSVLTNKKENDIFTLKVAGKTGSTYTYSQDQNIQFSVKSIVKDLYDDPDTRSSVTKLYNYLYNS